MNKKAVLFIASTAIAIVAAFFLFRNPDVSEPASDAIPLGNSAPIGRTSKDPASEEISLKPRENEPSRTQEGLSQTQEGSEDKSGKPDESYIQKLEPNLQQELLSAGFSQYEADLASQEMISEWKKGQNVIAVSEAIKRISDTLQLDDARRKSLDTAIMKGIKTSSQITFDQWNACMRNRVRMLSPCADSYVDENARLVAEASNFDLNGPGWAKAREAIKSLVDEVSLKCALERDSVLSAFDVVLGNC